MMSYSLHVLKGGHIGDYIEGNTRIFDYSSYRDPRGYIGIFRV